ncbi:MAG: hypothetical protein DWQ10_12390 [Calditrichaeota bacterium]|nr:MAG: hypothetical protein DWQ10_12390 [Calditrichota bacterium]
MTIYFIAFGLMIVGFAFMAGMLHFAQWKKKEGSCGCAAGLEEEYLLSGKLPTTCSRTGQLCENRK